MQFCGGRYVVGFLRACRRTPRSLSLAASGREMLLRQVRPGRPKLDNNVSTRAGKSRLPVHRNAVLRVRAQLGNGDDSSRRTPQPVLMNRRVANTLLIATALLAASGAIPVLTGGGGSTGGGSFAGGGGGNGGGGGFFKRFLPLARAGTCCFVSAYTG